MSHQSGTSHQTMPASWSCGRWPLRPAAIWLAAGDEALRGRLQAFFHAHGVDVIDVSDNTDLLQSLQHQGLHLLVLGSPCENTVPQAGALDTLRARVSRYLAEILPQTPSPPPHSVAADRLQSPPLLGDSPPMQAIKTYLAKVAATDSTVLITGESGTGKELVAELIHRTSPRQQKPFVCLNCAAIPDSLVESELFGYERGAFTGAASRKEGQMTLARGGTLFLDEIGDMSEYAQAKILRALDRKPIARLGGQGSIPLDVRIIAATNQDLERLVRAGRFRQDLYFRLNVARVHLPPLRARKEDIPLLLDHYLRLLNRQFGLAVEGFTDEALAYLLHYDWPGNVRELKNVLEATFINLPSRRITCRDLPEPWRQQLGQAAERPQSERERLLAALFATHWNISQAAQHLQWSRVTLYRKMRKYQIGKPDQRGLSMAASGGGPL